MSDRTKANIFAILGVSAAVIWAANLFYAMAMMGALAMTQHQSLKISRLPNGGFMVRSCNPHLGMIDEPLFASSSIDEALAFIRKTLQPVNQSASAGQGLSGAIGFAGLDPKHYPTIIGFGPNGS